MSESRPDEQAEQRDAAGRPDDRPGAGLDPLPPSIAESLLDLIMESGAGVPSSNDDAVEPDFDVQPSLPLEYATGRKASGRPGGATDQRPVTPLEPVPASISDLLSSVCTEIQSGLADNDSISRSFDALDRDALHAHGVETVVELDRGRWTVDVVVVFQDGLIRHRIDSFRSRARAEVSARLIKRAAERELGGPFDV